MNRKIKIVAFTATRAEYGALKSLIKAFSRDPVFEMRLVVGGTHLKDSFGMTVNEIIDDGVNIDYKIDYLQEEDGAIVFPRSLGILQEEIGKYLSKVKPDFLVLLGDRYELIPVALSALLLQIPIAHVGGGEITEGAVDNQFRNALTKMSHLHFPGSEKSAEAIRNMAEESWRVFNVGELALDGILSLDLLPKEVLFKQLDLSMDRPIICATFHPETIDDGITSDFLESIFDAILKRTSFQIVATGANADPGGGKINNTLKVLAKKYGDLKFFDSLGQTRYFSLLKYCDLVLGNSSGALIEGQSFNVPVINVGKRQRGRLANKNVIHSDAVTEKIMKDLDFACSLDFKNQFYGAPNIFGDGQAALRITRALSSTFETSLFCK